MNLLPPPPLPRGSSPWEATILAEIGPAVIGWVRRTWGLASASMDVDDGAQKVYIEVMLACRRWAQVHGPTKPDTRYVWSAVHRAKLKLWRSVGRNKLHVVVPTGVVQAAIGDTPDDAGDPYDAYRDPNETAISDIYTALSPDDPESLYQSSQCRTRCGHVVDRVLSVLSDDDRRLMELHAAGYTGVQIAAEVGRPGENVAIVQRLYQLRKRSREHLRGLGIVRVDDAFEWDDDDGSIAD